MGRAVIKATRTYNADLVRSIMLRPEILATVAEDGQDPADYQPDVEGDCWLVMTAPDDVLVGLYCLDARNAVTVEIHAQVLPEHRKVYSKATGEAALGWILENMPECHKVTASVPAIYPNVLKFTTQFGFQVEGVNRLSYLKNGKIHDQWMLGITRDEING